MLNKNKISKAFKSYLPSLIKSQIAFYFPSLYDYINIKPYFAVLNVTDNCCFRCIMCDQWKRKTGDELSTEKWMDILLQLKEIGIKNITLSGGEPFLRRDIIEIISYANKIGSEVGVITNGYLLDKEKIEAAIKAGLGSFSISVDAVSEKFNNIRGIQGAYQKVLNSCKLLSEYKKNGIYVYLYFTLMKTTLDTYKDVFAIAEEFNFPFIINLFDYTPYFFESLRKEKNIFWINENSDFQHLRKLQKYFIDKKGKNPKSIYHTYSEIEYFRDYFKDPLKRNIPCMVSQQRLGIDSRGNVDGGCWSMGSFGNLKEESLADIINSTKYKAAHKNMFFKKCPGCSCGYPTNLRYHLPSLVKEIFFRIAPFTRKRLWR